MRPKNFVENIYTFVLVSTVPVYGLALSGAGTYVGTKMTTLGSNPWISYENVLRHIYFNVHSSCKFNNIHI